MLLLRYLSLIIFLTSHSKALSQKRKTLEPRSGVQTESSIVPYTNYKEEISFSSLTFHNDESFVRDTFQSNIHFSFVKFQGEANFSQASFNKQAEFFSVTFNKLADFSGANFRDQGAFMGVRFLDKADFSDASFREASILTNEFLDTADFSGARFFGKTDFSANVFGNIANFRDCVFGDPVFFFIARFRQKAIFRNVTLQDTTEFNFVNAVLPDTLDFSYNDKIGNEIDLSKADFTDSSHYDTSTRQYKRHLIFLYKTDISRIHFDYEHFELLFDLPEHAPGTTWLREEVSDDEREYIYEAVLKNFDDHGQLKSYRMLDIEHHLFKWKTSELWWLGWIPHYWWNFGYNKEWVFLWTMGFIVLFTFLNLFFLNYLNQKVYNVENIPKVLPRHFGSRIWYSFVYSSTIFFRLTLKIEKINFQRRLGTIYLILIYTSGIICLAYMANFVLQK